MAGMPGMTHVPAGAWITRSTDGGHSWSARARVDTGEACPCCRTALATGPNGAVYMAWRHVYPGNVREIVVARSADSGATWSAPVPVHDDEWHFDACPHAGPALVADSTGVVHVAWWTGKEGAAGVFYARSTDGGRSFHDPIPLGVATYSRAAHVQLSVRGTGQVIAAWDDGTREVPQIVVRASVDGGVTFGARVPVSVAGRAATFPVLGAFGDSVVIAWSEESAAAAAAAARAHPNMKLPGTVMGLDSVGPSEVFARRGVVQ
jgi:hypothetical protein